MNYRIFLVAIALVSQLAHAQTNDKPKLVVGIVLDQMRAEYLYRFQDNYSENGFKRLMNDGFNVKNMHYNYVPTYTGPGHASIYTGTTPANHGIVANDWYSREKGRTVYCAEDETVFLTDGSGVSKKEVSSYSRSPRNLKSQTITDELKLATSGRSKVVGISLKDRGAILPAGHMADYAFWYHSETGKFITSNYYTEKLPAWLEQFNARQLADSLLDLTWETIRPIQDYKNSGADKAVMEKVFKGRKDATFPYNLKKIRKKNGNFGLMSQVPFGNTLLTQMAKATIEGEKLGSHDDTDFLTISYSSTDYVGHGFGIRSKELEDTYVRMDGELSELLNFLDDSVGKGNYLLFLSADHAGSDNPVFLEKSRLTGKFIDTKGIKDSLNMGLAKLFGQADYIAHFSVPHIYFNDVDTPKEEILKAAASILKSLDGVKEVYVPSLHSSRNLDIDAFFRKSVNKMNSGDLLLHLDQGRMPTRTEGTTHGTAYNDDTHVPMLWYGWHVPKGSSVAKHTIDQITPTLSFLLDLPLPDTSSDQPIEEIFEGK
ncbi:alkaline phosphatase PafA [Zobellia galactanivorans]|uniref:Calcium-dependent ATPase n=1 Tax=Zobellia galactanivorans (strain DSM 12802 / CCUG 47099 / CIP 106680 / NCIMB 13871 / Dsij) TaxID=63186 RepID=G0LCS4_ZOBGA|nr:alkaline phosphatase PafA [Zobellia galactanivorans]CAZ97148.1 Calcium-dependent ATPase [Zobellia galactanivorans]